MLTENFEQTKFDKELFSHDLDGYFTHYYYQLASAFNVSPDRSEKYVKVSPNQFLNVMRTSLFMDKLTMTEDLNLNDDQFSHKVDDYRWFTIHYLREHGGLINDSHSSK